MAAKRMHSTLYLKLSAVLRLLGYEIKHLLLQIKFNKIKSLFKKIKVYYK